MRDSGGDRSGVSTAHVDLWQIYVDGHRPHSLPGASDGAIRAEGGTVAESSTPHDEAGQEGDSR